MENKPYKASAELILTGALGDVAHAKILHAILILADARKWTPEPDGYYHITTYELHKLTRKVYNGWKPYLEALTYIRQNLEIDWDALSRRHPKINIAGKSAVITDAIVEKDLAGEPIDGLIKFTLSPAVVERLIKPEWFGQVDATILFRIHGNYAFNAYLVAALTVIEKDSKNDEFYSKAYTMDEWRNLLGSGEAYQLPSQFRSKVFKRVSESLKKIEGFDGSYLHISWGETRRGLFQMRVIRTKEKPKVPTKTKMVKTRTRSENAESWWGEQLDKGAEGMDEIWALAQEIELVDRPRNNAPLSVKHPFYTDHLMDIYDAWEKPRFEGI